MSFEKAFLDRKDTDYLKFIAELLSKENLVKTAKPINEDDPEDKKIIERNPEIKFKATIYFSGLAALTLFGSDEKNREKSLPAKVFHDLLEKDVSYLNDHKVALRIKLLFAYPYSNFMYDLFYLEGYSHNYLSTDCIKNNEPYQYTFNVEPALNRSIIENCNTFQHMRRTLRFIQNNIKKENKLWNIKINSKNIHSPNIIVVKFSPINVLSCMLRINNYIFLDPYMYSKENKNAREMELLSPISFIKLPVVGEEKNSKYEKEINRHFCSYISHFKYLWEHPLTLYAADATHYIQYEGGLDRIKPPQQISYFKKAKRIKRKLLDKNANKEEVENIQSISDNWQQFVKNELLLNCSKILSNGGGKVTDHKIAPFNIFIIGSWTAQGAGPLMNWMEKWIKDNLGHSNKYGMTLKPIIIRLNNGETFEHLLYQNLDNSHLGVVFQDPDLKCISNVDDANLQQEYFSRPNIYLEKGFLMGKLRRRQIRTDDNQYEAVFTFKSKSVNIESDNAGIGYTHYKDENHCKTLIFKFIYWLWEVTSLNSEYALKLIVNQKINVTPEDLDIYNNYKYLIEEDIRLHH